MNTTYTLSVFTEDIVGLLNRITVIFTRRHINIESITASEIELKGIYRYTIVVTVTEEQVIKLVKQIEKQVEVLKAFYHTNSQIISHEIALYKLSAEAIKQNDLFSKVVNQFHAKILSVSSDFIVIEKTGDAEEISALFQALEPFEVLEFVRSGRVAVTRPMKTLSTYLKEIENNSKLTVKHFNKS